jgi:hypothetical protein
MTGPDPTPAAGSPENAPQDPLAAPGLIYALTVRERRVICYALDAMMAIGEALGYDCSVHRSLIKQLHVTDAEDRWVRGGDNHTEAGR